jgi:phage-related protein
MAWNITYYNDRVFKEISDLPMSINGKFVYITTRMEEIGPNLGMPHTRAMGKGLFEIRLDGQEGIARVFYCTLVGKEIVMLHSFVKKTQKTPKRELVIAFKRLKEVKQDAKS